MMPKQNKRPTTIISDEESDGDVDVSQQSRSYSKLDVRDPRPTAKQKPGLLKRVQTLQDDDSDNELSPGPPEYDCEPKPIPQNVTRSDGDKTQANIAELVAILTNSNASMKGRIDNTGRFELKFELNREKKRGDFRRDAFRRERTPSPVQSVIQSTESPSMKSGKLGKRIGWIK